MLDVFLKVRDTYCSQVENHPLQEALLRSKAALGSENTANFGVTETWVQIQVLQPTSHVTLGQVTELLNLSLLPECTLKQSFWKIIMTF